MSDEPSDEPSDEELLEKGRAIADKLGATLLRMHKRVPFGTVRDTAGIAYCHALRAGHARGYAKGEAEAELRGEVKGLEWALAQAEWHQPRDLAVAIIELRIAELKKGGSVDSRQPATPATVEPP